MKHSLALLFVIGALSLANAAPAAAAKPAIAEEPYSVTIPFSCQSSDEPLELHVEGTDRTFVISDKDGTPARIKVVNQEIGSITNLRTGESITWRGQRLAIFTPDEALEVGSKVIFNFSGLNFSLRDPEGKIVAVSSGHDTSRGVVVRFIQGIPVIRYDRAFNTPHLTHFYDVVYNTAENLLC